MWLQTKEEQAVYDTLDEAEYEKLVKSRRADANFVECDGAITTSFLNRST